MEFWKQKEQSMKEEAERDAAASGPSSHAARRHHKPPPTVFPVLSDIESAAGYSSVRSYEKSARNNEVFLCNNGFLRWKTWNQGCPPDKLEFKTEVSPTSKGRVQVLPPLPTPKPHRVPVTPLKPASDQLPRPTEGVKKDSQPAAAPPKPPPKPKLDRRMTEQLITQREKGFIEGARPEQRSSTADLEELVDKLCTIASGRESARFLGANTNPWRSVDWSGYKTTRENLRTLQVNTPGVEYLRILVHGPVGAGKSSFINSIASIFQERTSYGAGVDAIADKSFTKTLQTHYIRDGKSPSFLPFAICDIMGLENEDSKGVKPGDVIKVLQGHIKDGFKFSETKAYAKLDSFYTKKTHLSERIHCLVSVIPAYNNYCMDDAIVKKMRKIRHGAADLWIPHMVILSKVDLICPAVAKDLKLIYRSKKIKDKMEKCSNLLGVPMNCIFPVKNYNEETDLIEEVNVLLLHALTNILDCAEEHVVKMAHSLAQTAKRK